MEVWTNIWLSLHILGVALGLGGATVADTLFFKFLADFRISHKEADVMRWMSMLVVAALVLIYITGGALYMRNPAAYLASPAFVFKMIVIFVLTINGISLHEFISPRMVHISFTGLLPHVSKKKRLLRSVAFAMGAVSFTSWYTVFFTAMLKSVLPEGILLQQLLAMYAVVLCIAVAGSQVMEHYLHRRGLFA